MPTTITTKAVEESTFVLVFTFADEDGAAMTPVTLHEKLTDLDGTVINGIDRDLTPGSVQTIVYSGTALTLAQGVGRKRLCTLTGTYDSTYGTGLTFTETATFEIIDVTTVT